MTPREWVRTPDGIDWPTVLLAALTATTLVAVVVAASTSTAAFGLYNPSWDGTSEFRGAVDADPGAEPDVIRETERYDDVPADDAVAFVVGPAASYAGDDADRVRRFVDRGGTLVVLENFETAGNDLLADVGADARTDGRIVLDDRHYERGPAMPVATNVTAHTRTADVDRLTLNHATALEPNGATVLVATSDYAYLGDSPAAELDDEVSLTSYPIATVEPVGEGEVVLVGDPSIAINAMYDDPDNAAFLRAQYAAAEHVLFDLSHAGDVPPLTGAVLTIRERPLGQAALGVLAVGLLTVAAGRRSLLRALRIRFSSTDPGRVAVERRALSAEERAAYLRDRYPEWDEERIQRVVKALNHTRSKRDEQ